MATARWVFPAPFAIVARTNGATWLIADYNDVALLFEEAATGKIPHQHLVNRRRFEVKLVNLLGQRQFRDRHLILNRFRLLFADLDL